MVPRAEKLGGGEEFFSVFGSFDWTKEERRGAPSIGGGQVIHKPHSSHMLFIRYYTLIPAFVIFNSFFLAVKAQYFYETNPLER